MSKEKFEHCHCENGGKKNHEQGCCCVDDPESKQECCCHGEENCKCGDECKCGQECDCENDCNCNSEHKCNKQPCQENTEENQECDCEQQGCLHEQKSEEYLNLARQIQADFENFRRHAIEDIKQAKIAGQASVIEAFLPCLDTFKEAKKSISDENVLKGVEMIEQKIIDTLAEIGVQKIETVGEKYNPHVHNVIAVVNVADKENDVIVDEYQAGYVLNGKVIRYSKVIVNKKED